MYGMMFRAGPHCEATLQHAAAGLCDVAPRAGVGALECEVEAMPEVGGALLRFRPAGSKAAWFHRATSGTLSSWVYGEILSGGTADAAERVLEAFRSGGADAVRRLDGSFSALLLDREPKQLTVVGDRLGQRTVHHATSAGGLLFATHDVALVATGLVEARIDPVSAASVLSVGWSVGGKPLLAGVEELRPGQELRWRADRVEVVSRCPLALPERRERGAEASVNRRILDAVRERVRNFAVGRDEIHCDLTAGFDSRVVWAVLASVTEPEQRVAYTIGSAEGVEVRTARRIVALTGGTHRVGEIPAPSLESFDRHCRLLAAALNGDTSGKRALAPFPATDVALRLGGGGGELFRGYYAALARRGDTPQAAAKRFLERRAPRLGTLGVSVDVAQALAARVESEFERYRGWTSEPSDWFELFYALDRFGVWGRVAAQRYWAPVWNPFACADALEALFALPAPSSVRVDLHPRALKELFPRGYWLPLNATALPMFEGPGRLRAKGRRVFKRFVKMTRSLRPRRVELNVDTLRSELFQGPLLESLRAASSAPHSVVSALLSSQRVAELFQRQQSSGGEAETVGALALLESYAGLLREMRDRAVQPAES